MKWFNKWFVNKVRWALHQPKEADESLYIGGMKTAAGLNLVSESHDLRSPSLNFKVFKANGGIVIETRAYNCLLYTSDAADE